MQNKAATKQRKILSVLQKTVSAVFALAIWQAASMAVDKPSLLASPIAVLKRIAILCTQSNFRTTAFFSFSRIAAGFLLALAVGIVLGVAAGRFKAVEILLWPYMITIKSVPVASFIVLCFIWMSSRELPVFISFLMVLPVIYTNILQGIKSMDKKLAQMADVFKIKSSKRFLYIWLPQLKPFLISACSVTLGLAWKAGIAAEVIGICKGSIGEKIYESKIYYETSDLFAWTAVIVILSVVFEKIFLWIIKHSFARLERR